MRLAAYLRVSTDRQAEGGLGLEVQAHAIRAWARAEGHRVVAWRRDEGVSGSNRIESRVGLLLDVFDTLKRQDAGGLVVYRLNPLARDLMIQEMLLRDLWALGAKVFTTPRERPRSPSATTPTTPPASSSAKSGAVSEYERAMIAARLRAGRRRKADTGGYAYGAPRFGSRADHGELVEDTLEARITRRILELRADGLSYRQIAFALDAEGPKPRHGGRQNAVVRRIAIRSRQRL
jgi:DNA invertase Pin-like site-specific DNA recombinase